MIADMPCTAGEGAWAMQWSGYLRETMLTSWSCCRMSTRHGCHCAFTDLCGEPYPGEWPIVTHSRI